jgi:hypothetical protein
MKRLRSLVVHGALALASLAVVVGLLEVGARLYVRGLAARPMTGHGSITRYHPILGWDKPPGGAVRLRRPEYETEVRINAHGLRGPDRNHGKPPGVRRVLLLGDSFTEGYHVPEERTVRALLEAELAGTGCTGAEVINGGTSAYSTDQEYLFFQIEGYRYQPDLVVLLFFFNDLYYNTAAETVRGEAKPYFELEGDRLVLRNSPVPSPPPGEELRKPEEREYRLKPWRGSMALRLLSNRTGESSPSLHRFLARLGLVEPHPEELPPTEYWPYGPPRRPEVEDMWRRTDAILRALKGDVERRGARLLVFYIPCRFEVNDTAWELTRDRYNLGGRWRRERVFERLEATCRALGVALVDPRAALRRAESAEGAYLVKDGHWAAPGHAAAARVLAPVVGSLLRCR